MALFVCKQCGFISNEKNTPCVLCAGEQKRQAGRKRTYAATLPAQLADRQSGVNVAYVCPGCNKIGAEKVCLVCNRIGKFTVFYHNKRAYIQEIDRLTAVFTKEEAGTVARALSKEEKDIVYCNFRNAARNLYRHDIVKALAYWVLAFVAYAVLLPVAVKAARLNPPRLELSYALNGLGMALFSFFVVAGCWYLFAPNDMLDRKRVLTIGATVFPVFFLYILMTTLIQATLKHLVLLGFMAAGIVFLASAVIGIVIAVRARRKRLRDE